MTSAVKDRIANSCHDILIGKMYCEYTSNERE